MKLNFEKFREGKNNFKKSTKRNFQFSKFWRPQFWVPFWFGKNFDF